LRSGFDFGPHITALIHENETVQEAVKNAAKEAAEAQYRQELEKGVGWASTKGKSWASTKANVKRHVIYSVWDCRKIRYLPRRAWVAKITYVEGANRR
jgi:ribosomal protein L20